MNLIEAIEISGDYGEVLKNRKCVICDSKALPHNKLKIKESLTVILNCNDDICKTLHEKTEKDYYLLADFQDNAGEGIHFPRTPKEITEYKDITVKDRIENNKKHLKLLEDVATYKNRLDKFEPLVNAEKGVLASELITMGFFK